MYALLSEKSSTSKKTAENSATPMFYEKRKRLRFAREK